MNDTSASLQNLNPIVSPEAVGLLPLAPGWKILLTVIALLVFWQLWKRWLLWRANRYRREALRELERLEGVAGIPDLLKRAALSAFERPDIAALTGPVWHQFLDHSAGMDRFSGSCGAWLDTAAYAEASLSSDQARALHDAARLWLTNHRVAV